MGFFKYLKGRVIPNEVRNLKPGEANPYNLDNS